MTSAASFRRRTQAAIVTLLTLLGVLAVGTTAQAHDVLIGSEPAEGAVLEEAPESIVLTFNNAPLDVGSAITVLDAEGTTVAEGEGTVEGTDVLFPLDGELPAGELEVRWRVASSDGHPIEGVIPFTLDIVEPPEPETTEPPATEDPATEETEAATEPATTEEPEAEVATEEAAEEAAEDDDGMPTWLAVLIGIAALGAVAGLVALVVKRMRTNDDGDV